MLITDPASATIEEDLHLEGLSGKGQFGRVSRAFLKEMEQDPQKVW